MNETFEDIKNPSLLPKFFAVVGRGTNQDINRIIDVIKKDGKLRIFFERRSEKYLRIVYVDEPFEEVKP